MDFSEFKEYVILKTPGFTVCGTKGGVMVGKVENRQDGELDFLHRFYPPLKEDIIIQLEEEYSFNFPESLKKLYIVSDGLRLGGNLNIYGWGGVVDESGQAISLSYGNLVEVMYGKPKNMLVIGSIHDEVTDKFDRLLISDTGMVYRNAGGRKFNILHEYSSLVGFLRSVFDEYRVM